MKSLKKNITKISLLALASVAFVGCNKFLDINETPNDPLEVTSATLLPTGLSGTAFANSNELNRFASTIMSVTAGVGGSPSSYDRYIIDGDDFGNQWRFELYGGALVNYQSLIEAGEATDGPAYVGIGKIMKAFTFAMTTDIWGDVPYSDALKGEEQRTPVLDAQRDIYMGSSEGEGIQSLFDLVKEGLADLDREGLDNPGEDDIVYGGDVAKWKRAGNSLLLKLAMQISLVEPAYATTIINEVIAGDEYINDNDANLSVKFGGQVGSQAPIWTLTHNSLFQNELMISTAFVNRLRETDDPRLPIFVTRHEGAYVTIVNGFGGVPPAIGTRSVYNNYATGVNGVGPTRLLTYAQTCFNLAEAVVRLGVAGDAQALYEEGIRASMDEAGVDSDDVEAYFEDNASTVTLSGSNEDQIEQIITQKYISLYANGLEQWNDWRRTGYPALTEHQNAGGIDGTRPVRAVYLSSEVQRNPNMPQGGDIPQSNVPVWWNVN